MTEYVARACTATPQGHGQFTVVDHKGNVRNVTVHRRELVLGNAHAIIASLLDAIPPPLPHPNYARPALAKIRQAALDATRAR